MQYLLLGLAALLLFLLASRAYAMANPQVLARQLRVGAGVAALAGAGFLVFRGLVGYAMTLAALGSWLLWGTSGFPGFPGSVQKSPGQTSRVTTEHLEVELDHDTGLMGGRIIKGMFAGRDISTLRAAEVALLWHDCRYADPQSAQVLEAYLDRVHPTWREDVARGEREMRDRDGRMQPAEAYQILGLTEGASDEDIRRAHRELLGVRDRQGDREPERAAGRDPLEGDHPPRRGGRRGTTHELAHTDESEQQADHELQHGLDDRRHPEQHDRLREQGEHRHHEHDAEHASGQQRHATATRIRTQQHDDDRHGAERHHDRERDHLPDRVQHDAILGGERERGDGAACGNRTHDLLITSETLCRLS